MSLKDTLDFEVFDKAVNRFKQVINLTFFFKHNVTAKYNFKEDLNNKDVFKGSFCPTLC